MSIVPLLRANATHNGRWSKDDEGGVCWRTDFLVSYHGECSCMNYTDFSPKDVCYCIYGPANASVDARNNTYRAVRVRNVTTDLIYAQFDLRNVTCGYGQEFELYNVAAYVTCAAAVTRESVT
jgi:hypothetical protein